MFDWIKLELDCPICGHKLSGFQSKDSSKNLDELEFLEVDNFYTSCENCGVWVEFNLKEEVRKKFTMNDYEMTVKEKDKI